MPVGGGDVPGSGGAAVAASYAEGERLTHQFGVCLPVLSPVPAQVHPPGFRALHARPHDVPCAAHVRDQNQVEVAVAVDCEPDPAFLFAGHSAENITKARVSLVISRGVSLDHRKT